MQEMKHFQIILPKELWAFLKVTSADEERSMGDIIRELVTKYKNKCDKKLTYRNTNV